MFKQKIRNLDSQVRIMAKILFDLQEERAKDGKKIVETFRQGKVDIATVKGIKKYLRELYKQEFRTYMEKKKPSPMINAFRIHEEHGESYTDVMYFPNSPKVKEYIERHINLDGDANYYDYSPTGFWFADRAELLEFDERIVVVQGTILDC